MGKDVEIEAIVLTHNDSDHAGALPGIVKLKTHRIGAIWMLVDDDTDTKRFQKIYRAAREGELKGYYQIRRAEEGQTLWSHDESKTILRVIHPGFSDNIEASSPNDASAIIVLEVGDKRLIVWPGDLQIRKTAEITSENSGEVLVGPHHGGPSDYPSRAVRRSLGPQNAGKRRLEVNDATSLITPKRLWISVGTNNTYSHPRPGYLNLMANKGARVVCSQLSFCCDRNNIKFNKAVLKGSALHGLPAARSGVSCRGTMRLYLKGDQLLPDKYDSEHLLRVSKLLRPRCLKARGWNSEMDLSDVEFNN